MYFDNFFPKNDKMRLMIHDQHPKYILYLQERIVEIFLLGMEEHFYGAIWRVTLEA